MSRSRTFQATTESQAEICLYVDYSASATLHRWPDSEHEPAGTQVDDLKIEITAVSDINENYLPLTDELKAKVREMLDDEEVIDELWSSLD